MAKSQQTFSKKEKEKKRLKKRQDKLEKKQERQANAVKGTLENMMAYVDENGVITDTPPDPTVKKKKVDLDSIQISVPKKEDREGYNDDPEPAVRQGKVTFFNDSKGYGFIKDARSQENIFVHVRNVMDDISEGVNVEFEIEQGPKGNSAIKVKVI